MNLIIEIGNSSTKLALYNNSKISKINSIENYIDKKFIYEFEKILKEYLKLKQEFKNIYISYVNKEVMNTIKFFFEKKFKNIKIKVIKNKKFKDFNINYKNISRFGSDRFFNCLGAWSVAKAQSSIVIDIGTATTFDVLNSKFEYLGGIILPGPLTSYSSLISKTSMIGNHKFLLSNKLLGKSTQDCLSVGFTKGNSLMIESLVDNIEKKYNQNFNVFLTGGLSSIFNKYLPKKFIVDKSLTLKGIALYIDNK